MVRPALVVLALALTGPVIGPAAALAQVGAPLTACVIGQWVMVPGYPDPGTIQTEDNGVCVIQMQNSDVVSHPPGDLVQVASPGTARPSAPPAPGSLAEPAPGSWTCAIPNATDGAIQLSITDGGGYSVAGQQGTWSAIDAQSIEFENGPYALATAMVVDGSIRFMPPGGAAEVVCIPGG